MFSVQCDEMKIRGKKMPHRKYLFTMKLRSDIFNETKPIHEQNGENSTEKWKTEQHFESMSN